MQMVMIVVGGYVVASSASLSAYPLAGEHSHDIARCSGIRGFYFDIHITDFLRLRIPCDLLFLIGRPSKVEKSVGGLYQTICLRPSPKTRMQCKTFTRYFLRIES
jgi:hypothetical protein